MKKFIFGFIGMLMATMVVTSCGNSANTQSDDTTAVDSVEVVDTVGVAMDTLAVDSVEVVE